jgi:hypothetical protein
LCLHQVFHTRSHFYKPRQVSDKVAPAYSRAATPETCSRKQTTGQGPNWSASYQWSFRFVRNGWSVGRVQQYDMTTKNSVYLTKLIRIFKTHYTCLGCKILFLWAFLIMYSKVSWKAMAIKHVLFSENFE